MHYPHHSCPVDHLIQELICIQYLFVSCSGGRKHRRNIHPVATLDSCAPTTYPKKKNCDPPPGTLLLSNPGSSKTRVRFIQQSFQNSDFGFSDCTAQSREVMWGRNLPPQIQPWRVTHQQPRDNVLFSVRHPVALSYVLKPEISEPLLEDHHDMRLKLAGLLSIC